MSRKLASIQIIKDITPIEGADKIELASVLGWTVVVKKNSFNIGDKVVYFEIDSCLPVGVPEYEFLRKSSYKNSPILGEVFRLKTQKMRGKISQGLILPIDVCFKDCRPLPGTDFEVGEDVTDLLNIKKWVEPEQTYVGGDKKGKRPDWIEKSDETRIQSAPELLEEFRGLIYYITTKYDGSSHFIAIDNDDQFHFGSHNLELLPNNKEGTFYSFIVKNDLEKKLRDIKEKYGCSRLYVIGEWCGHGIQKNRLQLIEPCWYPFTISIDDKRLNLEEMQTVCELLDLQMVQVEEVGKDLTTSYSYDDLLERAGKNLRNVYPGQCEGIVIRPFEPTYSPTINGYLSMKIINNNYLLKEK